MCVAFLGENRGKGVATVRLESMYVDGVVLGSVSKEKNNKAPKTCIIHVENPRGEGWVESR